jgi:uncharacterized protein (TIGR03067 family)
MDGKPPSCEGAAMSAFLKRAAVVALVLFNLAVPPGAAEPDPEPVFPAKADLKKMQGTWVAVRHIVNGVDVTKTEALADLVFVIKKDQVVISGQNSKREGGRIELDARKKPPTFDLFLKKEAVATVRGIYGLGKDELTIAFTENRTKARPTKFDGKDGAMLVLKRQKPK